MKTKQIEPIQKVRNIIEFLKNRSIRKEEFDTRINDLLLETKKRAALCTHMVIYSIPLNKDTKVLLDKQIREIYFSEIDYPETGICLEQINIMTCENIDSSSYSYSLCEYINYKFENKLFNKSIALLSLEFSESKWQITERKEYNSTSLPFNVTFANKIDYDEVKAALSKAIKVIEDVTKS